MKRYFPEKFNVVTSVDDIGAVTDISRITGEDLYTYKKRILESSQRIANSSYEGLINGINRELGLERQDIIEINLKNIICGDLSWSGISYADDIILDNRLFTGTVNGSTTFAVDSTLTVPGTPWIENELSGLELAFGSLKYKIISNTINKVKIIGTMSGLIGQSYTINANWVPNSLIGLAIHIGKKRYAILENSNNQIKVDAPILNTQGTQYCITANGPRIKVTASSILLYKEYISEDNFQLDLEINLRQRGMQHTGIVDLINKNSVFFYATDLIPLEISMPAFTVKQQDSDIVVNKEIVPGTKFFKLKNKQIKSESIKFSETSVFFREVPNVDTVTVGPYYSVDYEQGIIRAKSMPSGRGTVSYRYMDIPFKVESVPAIVTSFADKNAESYFFAQQEKRIYTDQRDRYISSQPKSNMIEYISELLKVTDQSWGK